VSPISNSNVEAAVLPGVVVVDFDRLEVATWPFRIGGVLIHRSWYNMDDHAIANSAIRVLEELPNNQVRCTSGESTYKYNYSKSSFDPVDDWLYLNSKLERQKKGFGKWFSERANGGS